MSSVVHACKQNPTEEKPIKSTTAWEISILGVLLFHIIQEVLRNLCMQVEKAEPQVLAKMEVMNKET